MPEPYVFKYTTLDPAKLRPIGDRYLVEVLPVQEEPMPSGIFLPELLEERKGWLVGVVFSMGNGHRLEVPDPAHVIPEGYDPPKAWVSRFEDIKSRRVAGLLTKAEFEKEEQNFEQATMQHRASMLGPSLPIMGDHCSVMRTHASVPMFFQIGEVIFIERWSGRQFTIQGKEFRFVNQVDCLGTSGVFLRRTEDGNYVKRDLEAERLAAPAATNGHRIHLP